MAAAVSISNAPRDFEQLKQLKRGQLVRLAVQLNMLDDDARDAAFKGLAPDQQAAEVYNSLIAYDQSGGAQQAAVAPQPAAPPPQMAAPVAPPQQAPAPMAPPQQMQTQMAPPPQVQAPVPLPQQAPAAPPPQQQYQQYQQPMQVPPTAPVAPPPQQYVPPQPPPQTQMAPQPQAPVAPPPYQPPMQPQTPAPPPAAPQTPLRQPQTLSDPSNAGAGQAPHLAQLKEVLGQVLQGQGIIGQGIDSVSRTASGTAQLMRTILAVQLVLAEQSGVDADDLVKLMSHQDPNAVENLIAKLGGGAGK